MLTAPVLSHFKPRNRFSVLDDIAVLKEMNSHSIEFVCNRPTVQVTKVTLNIR